jgi:type VI secretion system protein ImpC
MQAVERPAGWAARPGELLDQVIGASPAAAPTAAATGIQSRLDRVRRPRCSISYDVEVAGALTKAQLPFVVAVLADLAGNSAPRLPLDERKFFVVDRDNFNDVMQRLAPQLGLRVRDCLAGQDATLDVVLRFKTMSDFEPAAIAMQVAPWRELLETRRSLAQQTNQTTTTRLAEIDARLSAQLNEVLHHRGFQRLESSWRGLHYLVHETETGENLKIRVFNISQAEALRDLGPPRPIEECGLFQKVHGEWRLLGGSPYGLLVGDFEFGHGDEDMMLLERLAELAALVHAPFIAAPAPGMFQCERMTHLPGAQHLKRMLEGPEYARWRAFRESDRSRYVALTVPPVLARPAYGDRAKPIAEFRFEENVDGPDHSKHLWMSSAWAYAARVTDAFSKWGWFHRMRGVQGGGKVEGLPVADLPAADGTVAAKCSTEIALDERREFELSAAGFLPLQYVHGCDDAVFLGTHSCHRAAHLGAESSQIPVILGAARFVHYLLFLARDKVGAWMDAADCERWLNHWIKDYVHPHTDQVDPGLRLRKPWHDAAVEVRPVPAKPGSYELAIRLALPTEMPEPGVIQLVAEIPSRL